MYDIGVGRPQTEALVEVEAFRDQLEHYLALFEGSPILAVRYDRMIRRRRDRFWACLAASLCCIFNRDLRARLEALQEFKQKVR